jgi:tetratricopeptide (TPR) repeat protein
MSTSNEVEPRPGGGTVETEAEASGDQGSPAAGAPANGDAGKLAELDEALERFTSQKRWSDVIRTLLAKADAVDATSERVDLLKQAGTLYVERSANQAEAIKCFERVLEEEPYDPDALARLKEMYEKRRDWERLVRVMEREAERLDPAERAQRYLEMAQLATERLRKPDLCIELWRHVLDDDPNHPDALVALANLYERAREWAPLAEVLDRRVEQVTDEAELRQLLQKLGMIYADKLDDADGAVRVFRRLLEIDPDDRRAQEQLKRRYVALRAWDDLEAFYAHTERWDELIRTLEREADAGETSAEEKVQLLFRAARLWETRKEQPARAARAYEKVLEVDPKNLDAAEALTPIYEKANDARKLVGVYEVRLEHIDDPGARLALLRETALLYEERLRDPSKAYEFAVEAFVIDPFQEVVREDIERLARATGGWQRVAEAYERAIGRAETADQEVGLRLHFGRILQEVDRPEEAVAQYRAILDADPANDEAIAALAQAYEATERWSELLEITDRRLDLEVDPEARRRLAYERAGLLEQKLERPAGAIDAYAAILDEWGDDERDAYAALDRLYQQEGRYQDLAALIERRIHLGPETEELAALEFRLGRTLETQLGDRERAVELYREVLVLIPEHDGAREALEGLLDDASVAVLAAEVLEPLYEMREAWEPLVRALDVLQRGATDDVERRLELLGKMGDVQERHLGDADAAFETFGKAMRLAPDRPEALGRLESLAIQHGRFPDLVELLGQLSARADDPALARSLAVRAARLSETQLEDAEGAIAFYRQVLGAAPEDEEVLDALESLYTRGERWRDLLDVLHRKSELAVDPVEKEQVLTRMALLHQEQLGEANEAVTLYKQILEIDPTSENALRALDGLFEAQERWGDLADNLERQLAMAGDPDTHIAIMLRLASVREHRMGATDAAIETYREVLDQDPQNEAALSALERLLESPEHELAIAETLEPLYRARFDHGKLIGVLEVQARAAGSSDRRVELLGQVAELWETALDDLPRAFETQARALGEDPGNDLTQRELDRLAGATGAFEALADVYEAQVGRVDDPQLSVGLLTKVARIREEQLGDVDGAVARLERVLVADEQNIEAVESLERLFQLSERYEDLAKAHLRKAALLPAPDDQKTALFRAASIYEEILERPRDAVAVYDRVLEVDPDDLPALDKLVELHLRLEDWSSLLAVYERKADVVVDPVERKQIYVEVGAVYEREVGDLDRAIDTYQRILEIDPDDLIAISRLDALYQASGNWPELLSVLEREVDLAPDPDEALGHRFRIASLWHQKLDDPARAVEIFRDILVSVPDHEPSIAALEGMLDEGVEPLAAAAVLEPLYESDGRHAELVRVHEVQVRHEPDPLRRVDILHRIAELRESMLGDPAGALEAHARALHDDDQNEHTLASLERLAEPLDAFPKVAALYDREVARLREDAPDRAADLALRAGAIHQHRLGDVEGAIERFEVVLESDPMHPSALAALDGLYQQADRWEALAGVLEREAQGAPDPDEILAFQFRLGQVLQSHLGRVDAAIEQYREILATAPEHVEAQGALEELLGDGVEALAVAEILEPLYRQSGSWDRLINVLEVRVAYEADPFERVQRMVQLAETAEEQAGDHTRAFEWLQRALFEDPGSERVLDELDRLATLLDGWRQLANTFADVLEEPAHPVETRVDIGKRLARIFQDQLGEVDRAEATLRYTLGLSEPGDADVLASLDRIYEENGAFEALASVLERRIEVADLPADQSELAFRWGRLLEHDLGRPAEAVRVYEMLLREIDPEHPDAPPALEGILVAAGDWEALDRALSRELEVALGDSAQSDVLAKQARLASDKLGDRPRAVDLWKKVLDLRGEDPEALNALGDLYSADENWRDLVDVLEREAAIVDSDGVRTRIFADLGRVWYERLGREQNALDSWERVLDIDPGSTPALFEIARIHREGKQHQELADTLRRVIDVGRDTLPSETLEPVWRELGAVYETALEQPMDAVEAYREALALDGRNFETLDALERIHRAEAQWEDCVDVLERRVAALDAPEAKVETLLTIAGLWATEVGEPDKGTSAFERILELEPLHDHAFARLEELHREGARFEALIDLYFTRVEASPGEAIGLLRRIADVYEKELDDPVQAFEALQTAWTLDFQDAETVAELERVTRLARRWNELLQTANDALQQVEESEVRMAICLHAARWYGQELDHPEYAIPYYERILNEDPGNLPAMRQMVELYRTTQQWQNVAQVLGSLVDLTYDPAEKADVYVQMGELCEDHLGMAEQAPHYYLKALEVHEENLGALRALERLYVQNEAWDDLLAILDRKARALDDPEEQRDTRLLAAEVLEDRFGAPEEAISEYRAVLEIDAGDLQALKGLERLYARQERWTELLGVLEKQFEVVTVEKERIGLLTRIAGMYEEEFVKPEKAAERLEQVVEIDPTHEGALRGLARLYRSVKRWDALLDTYERHVDATSEREERIRLFKAMADVRTVETNEPERAVDALLEVLHLDEDDTEAREGLGKLYERQGDYASALQHLEHLARILREPVRQVTLNHRIGSILDGQVGDRIAALEYFERAIDLDPTHLPSLEAMRRIYIDSCEWVSAARTLEREAEHTESPRAVARLLVELGRIADRELGEHERAIGAFERARERDPDNEDAALPLADEYYRQERWQDAFPLLKLLVQGSEKAEREEQRRLAHLLGDVAARLGEDEEAVRAFGRAHQVDPNDLSSLSGLAAAHYRRGEWEEAFKHYQMVLVHHRDQLGPEETTDTFYRLGVIKREQGERRKALNMFDKALEEDSHHRPTLEAVVDLHADNGEWEQVIAFKTRLLEVADTWEERFTLHDAIGDIYRDRMRDLGKAVEAYNDADALDPQNHVLLHKLLESYQRSQQWDRMIEVITRISDLDDRPEVKAKYAYTVGVIHRDELNDPEAAIGKFNEALDYDIDQLKAFEAINKLLTERKDWKQLERAFRKMLHRVVGKGRPDLEFNLWHNLGIIYRDRQKEFDNAAEAFKMASNLQPDNLTEHQILAELFAIMPERVGDAIEEHQYLLREDPYRVDSYRALYKLYFDARAYDKAWCLAATLTFLQRADDEQRQFYEQYKQSGPIRPASRVDNERWLRDLFHPEEDLYLSKMFEAMVAGVHAAKASTDKALGLQKKHEVDPQDPNNTVTFVRTFGWVAQVLDLQTVPRLFLRPDVQGGLSPVAGSAPPASVCGQTLLSGFSPQELTFVIGRHLTAYRPEHLIRTLLTGHSELKTILLAGLRVAGLGAADPAVDQTAQVLLGKLPPAQQDALRNVARRFVEAGGRSDVKQWMRAVELTSCRAGFLLCNDLETAARMIQALPPEGATDLPAKEKVKELVLFSVSESYFNLREALGIQITV